MVIIMEMAMAMTMAMVQLPRPPAEPSSVLMSWPEGEALTIDHWTLAFGRARPGFSV